MAVVMGKQDAQPDGYDASESRRSSEWPPPREGK